ncbi:tRNA pseudouridine(13) synthase TruD [Solemya velum gill symbiont]|uniref:tRNA pseudouridine(13) synthase TruD n=1 Tax=Solemya velum gill symbiont TaxID=2340 RepID=UPI000997CCA6|nr:tRNA pseudouridine(13) synthase TruD [Solemya velum gill symbiont]
MTQSSSENPKEISGEAKTEPAITPERQQAENFSVSQLACAYGGPVGSGTLRSTAEDFFVEEQLSFDLTGEGEHLFLFIEKRGENTADVADMLAKIADVRQMNVSYAGLKDRHAVTRQWFSISLPGKPDPDFSALPDNIRILDKKRNNRKLRRGALLGNRFELRIRELDADIDALVARLEAIKSGGFPNYFGEQRFGRGYGNLSRAIPVLARGKTRRKSEGMNLSAVRSMLFNLLLSKRVELGRWCSHPLVGDVMQLGGSSSLFVAESIDAELERRLNGAEINLTGCLCGKAARVMPVADAADFEQQALADYTFWINGLQRCKVDADRRSLRTTANDLQWEFQDDMLVVSFSLPKGSYATALIRELIR